MSPSRTVEVSAAILLREAEAGCGGSEFLLAQRPPDKVYAGYWEFPGGKVEVGESFHDALLRELREELHIEIEHATPWLCREFSYPHADVRLKFFRVTAWNGDIHPHEHTGITWTRLGAIPDVDPVLPANGPILRALALPETCAITHAEEIGVEAELQRLEQALRRGLRLVQLRDKTLPADERRRFAQAVARLAASASAPGCRVLVNDDEALAREIGEAGVHLSSAGLAKTIRRPDFEWVAASCHSLPELERAEKLGVDFAVLGPVLPTATHPGAPGMGWETFARLIERSSIPVFALGGQGTGTLATAQAHGAHGVAMMRGA